MLSNFFKNIGNVFQTIVENLNEQKIITLGTFGFLILIITMSILLLKVSSQPFISVERGCDTKYEKNIPGILMGSTILIFSFFMLILFICFREITIQFSTIFASIVCIMFLICFIMLIIGFATRNDVSENFAVSTATGICEENGELGHLINGICYTKNTTLANKYKQELKNCEAKKEKISSEECSRDGEKFVSANSGGDNNIKSGNKKIMKKDISVPEGIAETASIGICEYIDDNGERKFGYSHPAFGTKCVSNNRMGNMLKSNPKYGKITNIKVGDFSYNPYQSTQCYAYPKEDLLQYDLKCKAKFGDNFGVKAVEGFGCPPNDNRGLCEVDYQMGAKLDKNSTRCVPLGTDMNDTCNNKHMREKTNKYQKMGYKKIEFSGCPKGYQRAICDGNYYNGKQLFKNTTEPFSQSMNPNRECKEKFGKLSFAQRIITDNCNPGYIRAVCSIQSTPKP